MPNWNDSQSVPSTTNHEVENKKQKVAVILHTNTVIYPWAMMVHHKNTPTARSTMMCTARFYFIAFVTISSPDRFQIFYCFRPIPHCTLHISCQSFKSVALVEINLFSTDSVFVNKSESFNHNKFGRSIGLDNHCHCVIKHYIEAQYCTNE